MSIIKSNQEVGVFITWAKYCARVEILAPILGLKILYFHYSWEERTKFHKAISYLLKTINTFNYLFSKKPSLIFITLPPTPLLYYSAFYSWMTGSTYVSDCHNAMIHDHWYKWVFVKKLLGKGIMIMHNVHAGIEAKEKTGFTPFVLRNGIAQEQSLDIKKTLFLERFGLLPKSYVILPWHLDNDEPIEEVIKAANILPHIKFVMTWYSEKLPSATRNNLPSNVILTGYLNIDDFNQLFANAGIALILTKWENIQLNGMQEAMAFVIPAVVSDLNTARFLYKDAPVYVKNNPESIAEGVRIAFENRLELLEKMKKLRINSEKEFFDQIEILKVKLNLQK